MSTLGSTGLAGACPHSTESGPRSSAQQLSGQLPMAGIPCFCSGVCRGRSSESAPESGRVLGPSGLTVTSGELCPTLYSLPQQPAVGARLSAQKAGTGHSCGSTAFMWSWGRVTDICPLLQPQLMGTFLGLG